MRSRAVKAVLWRELLDLSRDIRVVLATILLPLVSLPTIALMSVVLYSTQSVSVIVELEEEAARDFAERLRASVEEKGRLLGVELSASLGSRSERADVYVTIPRGFSDNLSRLDGRAYVRVSRLVGSSAGDVAYNAVQLALSEESSRIVNERISRLSSLANVTVDPESFKNPLYVFTGYHAVTGAEVKEEVAAAALTARVLQLALLFVVYPAVVFMTDAVLGERERRTLEKLLSATRRREDLLLGKMIASALLGLLAAVADSAAVLIFFLLAGIGLGVSAPLALFWLLSALALIALSSAVAAIISSRSETVRAAQVQSVAVLSLAMLVYFASFAVDFTKLPVQVLALLYLIPFTHASLAVQWASTGGLLQALLHLLLLYASSALFLFLSFREFRSERLLLLRN
ncbi:MAG: ABC transporter permease subunit [Acidilobaceae archaeon]|nr:ABC transporter permease subunit [Acidilobaceae archaeon]MDW7974573.1 ABC transporter permease subunit [Sulfolobales archaeon]